MHEPDDWRLTNQLSYLKNASLTWRAYSPASPENDHDHCEFCFAKFMVGELPDTLAEGYCTADRYHWVCKTCFADFSEIFIWRLADAAA